MSQYFYDVIIIGESLAATIAGTLLAKGGCRILTFRGQDRHPDPWFFSSLHLEKVLETLGGRACFTEPPRFQVLTREHRLEIHGSHSLEEELQREFPASFSPLAVLLQELLSLGSRLEETLCAAGELPLFGLTSRFRFHRKSLGRHLSGRQLRQPLTARWSTLSSDSARRTIATLFAGLSLKPAEELTLAEGALLWNSANRPDGVSQVDLADFLKRRYRQFHGVEEDYSRLAPIEYQADHLTGLTLKGGGKCRGAHFLLGDRKGLDFLPGKFTDWIGPEPTRERLETIVSADHISPLLAPRVIIEGLPPLRLEFPAGPTKAAIEWGSGGNLPSMGTALLKDRLSLALPFAKLQIPEVSVKSAVKPSGRVIKSPRRTFPGAASPVKLAKNLWYCHGKGVLPALGTIGEVLVGVSMANHLLRVIKH